MNKKGLIESKAVKSPYGPIRKNLKIKNEGLVRLNEFQESYRKITKSANSIICKGEKFNLGALVIAFIFYAFIGIMSIFTKYYSNFTNEVNIITLFIWFYSFSFIYLNHKYVC